MLITLYSQGVQTPWLYLLKRFMDAVSYFCQDVAQTVNEGDDILIAWHYASAPHLGRLYPVEWRLKSRDAFQE